MLERYLGETILAEMHLVGMRDLARKHADVEPDPLTLLRDMDAKLGIREARADRILEDSESIEPVENGPVIDDCTRRADDCGLGLENGGGNTAAGKPERGDEAARAGADDDDSMCAAHTAARPTHPGARPPVPKALLAARRMGARGRRWRRSPGDTKR